MPSPIPTPVANHDIVMDERVIATASSSTLATLSANSSAAAKLEWLVQQVVQLESMLDDMRCEFRKEIAAILAMHAQVPAIQQLVVPYQGSQISNAQQGLIFPHNMLTNAQMQTSYGQQVGTWAPNLYNNVLSVANPNAQGPFSQQDTGYKFLTGDLWNLPKGLSKMHRLWSTFQMLTCDFTDDSHPGSSHLEQGPMH